MLNIIEDKVWTRQWSPADVDKYVGEYQKVYFTYAQDEQLRERAASGGSVTALFVYLLETGRVDGVLAVRSVVVEGKVRPEFFIARTRDELRSAQGSKYSALFFVQHALPLLKEFEGNVAVVLLPCDAKTLHHARQKDPDLDARIKLVITLVCGHNSEPELTDAVVDRIRGEKGTLTDYVYRQGHWRGQLQATFEGGEKVEAPFSTFSDYRNLYFFAQRKCHHCCDHFGYHSDLSAGDVWSPRMRALPVKHTALITRSESGQRLIEDATRDGVLFAQEETAEEVCDGQARTLPFHYNTTSRSRVGRLFGLKIKDTVREKVRWNDYVVAFFAILNQKISSTAWGRRFVLLIPRPLLRLYLYFFKALESF